MEIRLSEKEITLGVVAYLNSRGMNVDPDTANIEFSVSRKPAGVSAVLHEGPVPAEPETSGVVAYGTSKLDDKIVLTGQAVTGDPVSEKPAEQAPEPEVSSDPEPVESLVAEPVAEASAEQSTTSLFQ